MNIIKHGNCYIEEKGAIHCRCGCEFEYDKNDIIKEVIKVNLEKQEIIGRVRCPECFNLIQLNDKA